MTSQLEHRSHPVVEFAHALTEQLEKLASMPVWSMTPEEHREVLRELAKAEAQLAALNLRVLAEAERSGAGSERAAASVADWLAIETRQTRLSARSDLKLAQALEHHAVLATALDGGAANVAQARAIVTALDRLPTSGEFAVDADQRQAAEQHLVDLARDYDAKALAVLGRKLFEVIAPDLADAFEAKVLTDQEAAAARRVMFSMREDDAGTCHGRFRIPSLPRPGAAQDADGLDLTGPAHHHRHRLDRCRPRCAAGRRSASSSRPSPASPCRRPAAAAPPSWSP